MKIDISFDSLPKEEKLAITKEVLASSDQDVKRMLEENQEKSIILNQKNENNSADKLEKYLYELMNLLGDKVLIEYLETHENIPMPIFEKILQGRSINVITWAINSKRYGNEFREKCYKSSSEKIRVAIVECEDTSEDMLIEMAKCDKSSKVRCALAEVRYESVLEILCNDCSSEKEKITLAQNSKTPREFLEKLAKEGGTAIRRALLKNKKISQEAIKYIYYNTSSGYILGDCIDNVNCPSEVLCHYIKKGAYILSHYSDKILGHPNASEDVIDTFANECIKEYKKSSRDNKKFYSSLLRKVYMHENASDKLKEKIDEVLE